MKSGVVFNIQRFTIHDGPGMRTELFLKGCPLRCRWCSNPESQSPALQPGVYSSRCIGLNSCGACRKACPHPNALIFKENSISLIDRGLCGGCMACGSSGSIMSNDSADRNPTGRIVPKGSMACVDACPADAIRCWGEVMSVDQCMEIIRRDRAYYDQSGGGVTVSGGEPLLQSAFVKELFLACRQEGISTCLESTLFPPWHTIEEVFPVTDLFIADLKMMNSELHREYTGQGNEPILKNLATLSSRTDQIILRIPLIPGINDNDDNIHRSADFIRNDMQGRIECLQLLSFMFLGEEKYQSLGIPYRMHELSFERESFQKRVEEIAEYFRSCGIACTVGSKK